jgi:drug/metabolite transporter (DMT)-like permease
MSGGPRGRDAPALEPAPPLAPGTALPRGPVAAMAGATLMWGATFVIIRDSLSGLDPGTLVFLRFAAASGVFTVMLRVRSGRVSRDALLGGALSGLLMVGGYLFQAIGLTTTAAGTSAFLTSIGSLFAGLFAWPLLGQRPTRDLNMGLALAAIGAMLMGSGSGLRLGRGEWWTLLGALSYALQVVAVSRFAPRADPIALAGVQSLVVALTLSPLAGDAGRQLETLSAAGWWRLGYLALAGSVAAPLLQIIAQRTLPAGRVGLLLALEPVFALVFAVTFGAERFVVRWWCGAALILAAVLLVERRAARGPAAPRATSA